MPEEHFLGHPDIRQLFAAVFTTLVAESDRGAVLVGFAYVDNHLTALFQRVAPDSVGEKKRDAVLSYPGPLASASAKTDVALFTRLIPAQLHRAIGLLRKIRNDVAHSPESFHLADHEARLREMYDLGPDVPTAINQFALEVLMKNFADQLVGPEGPLDADGKPYFTTPQQLFAHVLALPDVLALLEEKRRRFELAMAIVLICALLVHYREKARGLIGGDRTLAALAGSSTSSGNVTA
jgi:hypothetical protein